MAIPSLRAATSPRVVLFVEGRYGEAVAERLRERTHVDVHALAVNRGAFAELVSGAGLVAYALWRRDDDTVEALAHAALTAGRPMTGAVLADRYLYCGPLAQFGRGACYACFVRRMRTHLEAPMRDLALSAALRASLALGVAGFLPSTVALATSSILRDLVDAADPAAAGRLRRIDLASGNLVDTRVVPVHGCPRCTPGADRARFLSRLAPVIEGVQS